MKIIVRNLGDGQKSLRTMQTFWRNQKLHFALHKQENKPFQTAKGIGEYYCKVLENDMQIFAEVPISICIGPEGPG